VKIFSILKIIAMHTILIFILGFILITSNLSLANQLAMPINLNNELTQKDDDPLNGPKNEYYPNGKIMKEYTLKDGQIDGSYKFYNSLGKLVSDQYYKDGVPDGYLRTYYENGQVKAEMNMKGYNISGYSNEYDEDGTLRKKSMVSGEAPEISSQTTIYFKNGKVKSETTISQGKFVYSIGYDEKGRVAFEEKPGQSISYWYEEPSGKKHVIISGIEQK
jgi:antitoxin component YwqK of YwqJK toxin-antitoxin module